MSRLGKTMITVQFEVEYDTAFVTEDEVRSELISQLGRPQEQAPHRDPAEDVASWWTRKLVLPGGAK